jgi:predicted N-acetyltransferase YhbS
LQDALPHHGAVLPATLPAPPCLGALVAGTASDHHAVFELLQRSCRAPSPEAFNASLEDPFYEPCDRLLLRRHDHLIGHALLSSREVCWAGRLAPVTQVSWVATLPEYRGRGLGRRMVEAAHERIAADRSLAGILATRIPHFFARFGWAVCGRVGRYVAGARALLAHLSHGSRGKEAATCIRPWRRVELPALVRLYAANLSPGMLARSEETWRWLISRRAFDQIYVATESSGRSQLEDDGVSLAGYVITKGNDVLELMADPARPEVAGQLLQRVCGDAIEVDCHHLGLFAPPANALAELFVAVGGHREGPGGRHGEYLMAKLPDPLAVLNWMAPQLHARAEAARLARPSELSFVLDEGRVTIVLGRRSVKIASGKPSRTCLRLARSDLTRLVLGAADVQRILQQGRTSASSRAAVQIAAALFPRLPLWRAPLDDLME